MSIDAAVEGATRLVVRKLRRNTNNCYAKADIHKLTKMLRKLKGTEPEGEPPKREERDA